MHSQLSKPPSSLHIKVRIVHRKLLLGFLRSPEIVLDLGTAAATVGNADVDVVAEVDLLDCYAGLGVGVFTFLKRWGCRREEGGEGREESCEEHFEEKEIKWVGGNNCP